MTQKDRELLLKDLSGRLSCGVIGEYSWKGRKPYNRELTGNLYDELKSSWNSTGDSEFLPYLRPMLSITEEELDEFYNNSSGDVDFLVNGKGLYFRCNSVSFEDINYAIDWLNAHHFDYHGLILMELALEAPKEMYNIKEQ